MANRSNQFPKSERLKQQRQFAALRKSSHRSNQFPLLAFWNIVESESEAKIKVAFGAPKKHYAHASQRNLIKRRLRESYRTQKHSLIQLLDTKGLTMHLSVIVLKSDNTSYDLLRAKMVLLLQDIAAEVGHD